MPCRVSDQHCLRLRHPGFAGVKERVTRSRFEQVAAGSAGCPFLHVVSVLYQNGVCAFFNAQFVAVLPDRSEGEGSFVELAIEVIAQVFPSGGWSVEGFDWQALLFHGSHLAAVSLHGLRFF